MRSPVQPSLAAILVVTLVAATPATGELIDVQVDDDASGDLAGVSLTGNASSDVFATSGGGNATCHDVSWYCQSVSASGNSSCEAFGCLVVSAVGDSTCPAYYSYCVTISGTGNSSAWACLELLCGVTGAVSGTGNATGDVALSGTGHAHGVVAVSTLGTASGGIAISGCQVDSFGYCDAMGDYLPWP